MKLNHTNSNRYVIHTVYTSQYNTICYFFFVIVMQFLNFFQLTMFWTIAYTFFSCVSLSTFVTWSYLVATRQEGLFWSSTSCWQRRRYNYSNTKVERPLQRPLRPSNSLDIEKLKEEKSESHICESQTIERILYEKCLGIDIDLCILAKKKFLLIWSPC